MGNASLAQWLQRLESLHPKSMDLGLERVASVARELSLLPVLQPVVTVAGTNGKGSVVAIMEALLRVSGRRTGAYTSPHLLRFNERIRVAGEEATEAELVKAFQAIDAARGDTTLTYFEFATLAALLVFRSREVDVLVLEVGLGGRLDAVNIVDPSVAVITSIDLDHQQWLGERRSLIALEKAGILRRGRAAVIADPAPPTELLDAAARLGAGPVLLLGRDFSVELDGGSWRGLLHSPEGVARPLPPQPTGSLLPENICAALQAALALGVTFSDAQLARALAVARPAGRRQRLSTGGRDYLLDVAHNPAAVVKLLEYLDATPCKGRTFALFSAMADKDLGAMLRPAVASFDAWFLADQPGNARAATAAQIAELLRDLGRDEISISGDLQQALRGARWAMAEGDRLVVFGSFYTVAAALPLLERDGRRGSP
jgi:dihydrofolate synthase/folylpolyglutamate synthase